ncbi:hypothetical protein Tco_0170091, partial [Tanacetum coccineum]
NFLDAEELNLIQSPPNELEHIQLKVIDICGLSVYEAVLWCCCPRFLKLTTMFQTIYAEERNQVVKQTDNQDEGSSRNLVSNVLVAPVEGNAANYGSASRSNNKSNGRMASMAKRITTIQS